MKTKVVIVSAILMSVFFWECKEPVREILTPIKSWQFPFEDTISGYLMPTGGAAEGKSFARTNDKFMYTAGLQFPIPDSLLGKDLRVNIDCFIRKGESNARHSVVVQLSNPDTSMFWKTFEADSVAKEKDKWVHLVDSTMITAQQNNKKVAELRVFGWNATSTSYFDVDDLKIALKKVQILDVK